MALMILQNVCADDSIKTTQKLELLIRLIGTGDREALRLLYQATSTAVYGFSYSICRDSGLAEDVMQDVYLKIIASAAQYQPRQKPMAWILTITRNLSLNQCRAAAKITDFPQGDLPAAAENPSELVGDRIVLEQAMQVLGEQERQIVMLFAVSGLKHREIAAVLDMPLSTILSKYRRALQKLKKQLEDTNG